MRPLVSVQSDPLFRAPCFAVAIPLFRNFLGIKFVLPVSLSRINFPSVLCNFYALLTSLMRNLNDKIALQKK